MNRTKPWQLILIVIAIGALASAPSGLSSVGTQLNGNLQIADLTSVVITGDDIHNLPAGENRLVQKFENGNRGTAAPTGSVTFFIDSATTSTPLTKVGTGTLIFPSANSYGVTKVGPGTLRNTPTNSRGGITKLGSQRLILQGGSSQIVYEFRGLGLPEVDTVFFRASGRLLGLRAVVLESRSPDAMKGWPFQRLLIGPAKAIAAVEDWKAGRPGASKYVCSGGSCACSGTSDCLDLANSCSSDMNCDGSGSSIRCSCKK